MFAFACGIVASGERVQDGGGGGGENERGREKRRASRDTVLDCKNGTYR